MALDVTKYQLTQLLQDAWYRMGQMRRFIVTGGDTDTIENTGWAGVEEPTFEDDDPAVIGGTAVVLSAGGTAPEGEWGEITDYDSATTALGIRALSAAVASGDRIGIASPLFPVEDMIELANIAIQKLGEIDVPYTGISIVANQTEYSLPSYISRRPTAVYWQSNQASGNNQWRLLQNWRIEPAAVGTVWKLIVSPLPQAHTLQIWYAGMHPKLTAFDSEISPSITPELIINALIAEAFQWYNNQLGGQNQYFMQRENKAIQDLEASLVRYPVSRLVEQVQGFPHWGQLGEYVPGTSDLRG